MRSAIMGTIVGILVAGQSAGIDGQSYQPPLDPPSIGIASSEITPSMITEPSRFGSCNVEGIDGRKFAFEWKVEGRRGYRNPETDKIEATEGSARITADRSNLFASYSQWSHFADRLLAQSRDPNAAFGKTLRIELLRTDFEPPTEAVSRYAVQIQAFAGSFPLTKAVGFCSVRKVNQHPLTPAEVLRLRRSSR